MAVRDKPDGDKSDDGNFDRDVEVEEFHNSF